jgi:hypothetical protein
MIESSLCFSFGGALYIVMKIFEIIEPIRFEKSRDDMLNISNFNISADIYNNITLSYKMPIYIYRKY